MNIFKKLRKKFSKPESFAEMPLQPIFWILESVYLARAFYIAIRLDLPEIISKRTLTVSELARETGTHEESLSRILRALSSFGYFALNDENRYEMTGRAETLKKDSPYTVANWVHLVGLPEIWSSHDKAFESVQTGKNGFKLAHGMSVYEYFNQSPEFGRSFVRGMDDWTAWQCTEIVNAYSFDGLSSIVDVGGGSGSLIMEIASRYPELSGILFDLPLSIERAAIKLEENGLQERIKLIEGSFLDAIPPGVDVYMLKHILRDWDDTQSQLILENCIHALPPHGRILVIDGVIDPANGKDRLQKLIDLEQMFVFDGKMRTRDEWQQLFSRCNLVIDKTYDTKVVDITIMELKPGK